MKRPRFSLVFKMGTAADERESSTPVMMSGPLNTYNTIGPAELGETEIEKKIPEDFWIEAGVTLRKFETLTAEAAATGKGHERAYAVGQWFGGMVRAASMWTEKEPTDLIAEVRRRTGLDGHTPMGESYMGVGEIVSRPEPQKAANLDEPVAEPTMDGMGDRARASIQELPDLSSEELAEIFENFNEVPPHLAEQFKD